MDNLATVIMAAGKGTRMKNPDKSKVMFELKNKPMIEYVVERALEIDSDRIILIVGHQKQSLIDFIKDRFANEMHRISFAHQDEQLGTGHAVMQTKDHLSDFEGDVLILSGDVPLLTNDTLEDFISFHEGNDFTGSLISAIFDDPHGYGRIIRDVNEKFTDIIEEKDANEMQKQIKEINSGIYLVNNLLLFEALDNISTDNAQGEYYLTDIFRYFIGKGLPIGATPVENNLEITGVNTVEQLKELEQFV